MMAYKIHPDRSPDAKPDIKLEVRQRIIPEENSKQYVLAMSLPVTGGRSTQLFVAQFDAEGDLTFRSVDDVVQDVKQEESPIDSLVANNVFDDLYGDYQEAVVDFISDIYRKGY